MRLSLGKILVFGAGRLADHMQTFFQDVMVVDKNSADIADRASVERAITYHRPAIVVNAAAITSPVLAEQEPGLAWRVNTFGARNVAAAAKKATVWSVHISSNWAVDPTNEYAWSKRASEGVGFDLTIRTCFYDEEYWLLATLAKGDPTTLVEDDEFNPISIGNFLKALDDLLRRGVTGLVNVGTSDRISHYDFGILLARTFGLPTDLIQPSLIQNLSTPYEYPQFTYLEPFGRRISIEEDLRDFRDSINWRIVEEELPPISDTRSR